MSTATHNLFRWSRRTLLASAIAASVMIEGAAGLADESTVDVGEELFTCGTCANIFYSRNGWRSISVLLASLTTISPLQPFVFWIGRHVTSCKNGVDRACGLLQDLISSFVFYFSSISMPIARVCVTRQEKCALLSSQNKFGKQKVTC